MELLKSLKIGNVIEWNEMQSKIELLRRLPPVLRIDISLGLFLVACTAGCHRLLHLKAEDTIFEILQRPFQREKREIQTIANR